MPTGKGFLLVTMEPPPALEEEFKDWYDTEHVPERRAVAGFETATRYVCTAGWPRFLAFYDLTTPEVIHSQGYRAISGERFSPWTKRILARVSGFYRVFGEQLYGAGTSSTQAGRVLLLRARACGDLPAADWIAGAHRTFEARQDFRRLRVLRSAPELGTDLLALVEMDASQARLPVDLSGFAALATRIDLVNEYAPLA